MSYSLFTSETVSRGHPDKVADQISDAILDACLAEDTESKVACETMISKSLVVLGGEITTKARLNYRDIVRGVLQNIGYDDPSLGFDYHNFELITSITEQSPDIAIGVTESVNHEQGAGDQGMMFGYACDETKYFMPMPITLSQQIMKELERMRYEKELFYLRPDAKCQVTVEYDTNNQPAGIHTIVLSTQHHENASQEDIKKDMQALIRRIVPKELLHNNTRFLINPTGRFVHGGPGADCGLTGRKIIVDTYGGMARHGGGGFSGKDPSKVDRSATYAARYVAKNIVAAGLARRCEVQVAYAIGVAQPVSIKVSTKGTSIINESIITDVIPKVFNLSPKGIINMLNLKRPIYQQTAYGGHFGYTKEGCSWEKTDRVDQLNVALAKKQITSKAIQHND